jgi:hypothetical protein
VLVLLADLDPKKERIASMSPITLRPPEALLRARLRYGGVGSDLGELLRLTSHAVASVLPPASTALNERADAAEDPRLADLVQDVAPLAAQEVSVLVDVEGGYRVTIEPGEPPAIVIGEALVDDATAAELRFHIVRAMTLIELGHLLFERPHASKRRGMLDVLLAAADPESKRRLSPDAAVAVDHIRAKLGPSGLAEVEPLVSRWLKSDLELGGWMYGAVSTANRYALLAAGDLQAAVRALRRNDPHTLAERYDKEDGRVAALRRSPAIAEIVAFALSEDYVALVREGRSRDSGAARF